MGFALRSVVLLCVCLLATVFPKSLVADSLDSAERIVLQPRQGHILQLTPGN